MMVRLQKYLAECGVASRRACEEIIRSGRVKVNGRVVEELGSKVDAAADHVSADGRRVQPRSKLYVALHKPYGCICSKSDPEGRPVISDLLPREWSSLQSVGRLDYNSEGLIFLTNDGEFSLRLTHPRYGIRKKYLVTVAGRVEPAALQAMIRGVYHEGERLRAAGARLLRGGPQQSLVEMELTEGKNREVRRLFESQHLKVEELKRIQIGPIKLGELPKGKWRMLNASEVRSLMAPKPSREPAEPVRSSRRPVER